VPSAVRNSKTPTAAGTFPTDLENVAALLSLNPEYVARVRTVLEKYSAEFYQRTELNDIEHNRSLVAHFVNHPHPEFDSMEPFYTIDLGKVVTQMAKFRKHLPNVQPHYAMKCNSSLALMEMISALGGSFDCASEEEFMTVMRNNLVDNIKEDIIFANPTKQITHIKKACKVGLDMVTFDDCAELRKLKEHWPNAKCVLRLRTEDSAAVCAFSTKFGARMDLVPTLLALAQELGMQMYGVSFHVGSGNSDPNAYLGAIRNARKVFDMAKDYGFEMQLLDIGGGFPGQDPSAESSELSFEQICAHVRPELQNLFPTTRIIAEPGRFFAASTYTLGFNIFGKRIVPHGKAEEGLEEHQYYANDGLYHSFNAIFFDHQHPDLYPLVQDHAAPMRISTIYGPTCDSLDCILKHQRYPEMEIGDWMFVKEFGAYTAATASAFNGFATRRHQFICTVPLEESQP
jgi:ornithine decarboxylase